MKWRLVPAQRLQITFIYNHTFSFWGLSMWNWSLIQVDSKFFQVLACWRVQTPLLLVNRLRAWRWNSACSRLQSVTLQFTETPALQSEFQWNASWQEARWFQHFCGGTGGGTGGTGGSEVRHRLDVVGEDSLFQVKSTQKSYSST